MADSPLTEFDYLLNRYTAAAQHEKPATQGFKGHHDALYAYVRDLERRAIAAPGVAQGWQPIESAPENEMVLVGWLDPEDEEHPERHDFDLKDDDCWQRHHDDLEHFMMVAPGGSRGPSQTAPYTHWMRIGKIPAAPSPTAEQPDHIRDVTEKVQPTPVSIKGGPAE